MSPFSVWSVILPRTPIQIAPARASDLPVLAAIHAASFPHSWSEVELSALIRDPNVICLVARRANAFGTRRAIGFLLLRVAADEAEVLTIAVDPRRRGLGCGRDLMEVGMRELYRERIRSLFLEVDAGNRAALALYRKLRFHQVGERRGYYRDGNGGTSTALVMRADLA